MRAEIELQARLLHASIELAEADTALHSAITRLYNANMVARRGGLLWRWLGGALAVRAKRLADEARETRNDMRDAYETLQMHYVCMTGRRWVRRIVS